MLRVASAVAAVALLAAAAASAGPRAAASYSFGRTGGNIMPFTVSISQTGAVRVTGPVRVGTQQLGTAARTRLATVLRTQKFAALPPTTRCAGTNPDVAAFFVTVRTGSATRTVLVHGDCSPAFTKVYDAFAAAVGLKYGTG